MPRSPRQNILLKHDQILAALEKVVGYLAELHDTFKPVYPRYAICYENLLYMAAQMHEFVEEIKGHV